MKAYVTKYALTKGILFFEGEICSEGRGFSYESKEGEFGGYFWGKDWHVTKESAIKHADKMRLDRIASLRKQLAKLEKLAFA